MREAGAFCVNVLATGQEEIARSFSERGGDRFNGVKYTRALGNGSPRLAGAVAWMDATVEEVVRLTREQQMDVINRTFHGD